MANLLPLLLPVFVDKLSLDNSRPHLCVLSMAALVQRWVIATKVIRPIRPKILTLVRREFPTWQSRGLWAHQNNGYLQKSNWGQRPEPTLVPQMVKNLPAMQETQVPWRRAWQPTPVSLPGESHGQRSLEGESDMTEWLTRSPESSFYN